MLNVRGTLLTETINRAYERMWTRQNVNVKLDCGQISCGLIVLWSYCIVVKFLVIKLYCGQITVGKMCALVNFPVVKLPGFLAGEQLKISSFPAFNHSSPIRF